MRVLNGPDLAGQRLEDLVGKVVSDLPHVLKSADKAPPGQQAAVGDVEQARLDGQLLPLHPVAALDQNLGTEQPPLREIDLGAEQAEPPGIVEERRRIDETEHAGQVEIGARAPPAVRRPRPGRPPPPGGESGSGPAARSAGPAR